MTKFLVSADHMSADYRLDAKPFYVGQFIPHAGRLGFVAAKHGRPDDYWADLRPFGCGKSATTAEAAIRLLLEDNGCYAFVMTKEA